MNEINVCMLWHVFVSFLGFFSLFTRFLHDVQKSLSVQNFTLIVALFLRGLKLVTWGLHLHLHTHLVHLHSHLPKV